MIDKKIFYKRNRPKNYFKNFLSTKKFFENFRKNFLYENVIFIFSGYVSNSYANHNREIYKNIINKNNRFYPIPILGTLKNILIFILFTLPIRLFSKNKRDIIDTPQIDESTVFKSYFVRQKLTGLIVEKNTAYILNLLLSILLKKSKQIQFARLNFLKSKFIGREFIIKNQFSIFNEINLIVFIVSNFLKIVRTRNIISGDAISILGSIKVLSAKKNGIRYIEIFHGYPQIKNLIGIFPPKADIHIHWTHELINSFKKYVPRKYFYKYKCLGYPINFKKKKNSTKVLLLFPDLKYYEKKISAILLKDILQITNILSKFANVVVRSHPAAFDLFNKKYRKLIIEKGGVPSENISLLGDLSDASIVIGHESTVLVTALYNRIPAIMIKKSDSFYCDNVPVIHLSKIKTLLKSKRDMQKLCKNFKFPINKKFNHYNFNKLLNSQ
jgi:hypothetical protein